MARELKIHKTYFYILNIIVPFLMGTGTDLYVPSLPAIMNYFNTTSHAVQLTIALYVLAYGIGQVVCGLLSDELGRRHILLVSAWIYAIASFLAIFSPNITFLVFYRFLQGLSIGGLSAVLRAISIDSFMGLELNKVMSYGSSAWALGPILGPLIGGYLQHYFNWQANFYYFAIYGIVILIYAYITLKEIKLESTRFNGKLVIYRIKTILSHPIFLLTSAILTFTFAMLVLFNMIAPFLLQVVLHYSAVQYGQIALCMGFGYFFGTLLNRFAIVYFDPKKIVWTALISFLCCALFMVILNTFITFSAWLILVPIFLLFFSNGFVFPNLAASGLSLFQKMGGSVSAIFGLLTSLGCALITSAAATFPVSSPLPMAYMYLALVLLCMLSYCYLRRIEKKRLSR